MDKAFNLRQNSKPVFYGFIACWLVSVGIWTHSYTSIGFSESDTSIYHSELGSPNAELSNPVNVKKIDVFEDCTIQKLVRTLEIEETRSIDSHSRVYDQILEKHALSDILANLDFTERCDLYFKNLFIRDRNWFVDPNEDFPLDHRDGFDLESFKKETSENTRHKYAQMSNLEYDKINFKDKNVVKGVEQLAEEEFKVFWERTMKTEQKIVDYLSHLRIFDKCYVTSDDRYIMGKANELLEKEANSIDRTQFKATDGEILINDQGSKSCSELESRIYKWMSHSYPIYERWTGEIFLSPPDLRKFVHYPEVFKTTNSKFKGFTERPSKSTFTANGPCFFNKFKNSLNGKGIVLSIGDKHVDDTVRLIRLLRALNNHYPIQIVFYDSLSDDTKARIVAAARNKMIDLPESFHKVSKNFPADYLNVQDGGLPKQEVWFVNTYNAIHDNFKDKFKRFANKFLATLFNSFEEFMLVDADTVLLQSPSEFFDLKDYKTTGAYFFKDRTTPQFRPPGDTKFFQKITPSILDNLMFDIPIITQKTLGLEFFDGMNHFMESGVVLINRHLHFNSILTMLQLNFFKPVTSRVHGDKEIFWLGFAANGDEDYHFNKNFAASIGTLTSQEERLTSQGNLKKSQELCSPHPGHLDENGKLVWFNSGFKFCGKSDLVNFESEVKKQEHFKFLKDAESMREYYEGSLKLKNAVIPPFNIKSAKTAENSVEEPKEGWKMEHGYCHSYLWCAYSSIGGLTSDGGDNTQVGHVYEFEQDSIDLYAYFGDIWVGNE
ncbi:mannosyltransferase [Yamadazyma tenuis]|uniref:mannosyltransferase n=1 Tax=Candida tenuis TaxID=2315449 RepID=UPI00279ECED8|nr:mannosyltransferase [Yamadazyma tenuis]